MHSDWRRKIDGSVNPLETLQAAAAKNRDVSCMLAAGLVVASSEELKMKGRGGCPGDVMNDLLSLGHLLDLGLLYRKDAQQFARDRGDIGRFSAAMGRTCWSSASPCSQHLAVSRKSLTVGVEKRPRDIPHLISGRPVR